MFCPNCSQSFRLGEGRCPTCGFWLGTELPAHAEHADTLSKPLTIIDDDDSSPMNLGVMRGVKLMLIAVACLPVFKVLAWLYPQRDFLVPGTRSVDLFEQAGQAIILLLFVAGLLRAIYAIAFQRKRPTPHPGQ